MNSPITIVPNTKDAKERERRATLAQRMAELEELTREQRSEEKRDMGDTLRDTVFQLTGKKPVFLKHREHADSSRVVTVSKEEVKELKKTREKNRRDRHAEMFSALKDFVLENNLFVAKRSSDKLDRLTVINCIIEHVKSSSPIASPTSPTDLPAQQLSVQTPPDWMLMWQSFLQTVITNGIIVAPTEGECH